jgi:hypothetical protein
MLPHQHRIHLYTSNSHLRFQKDDGIKLLDSQRNNTFEGFLAKDTLRLYTHYFETDGASQTLLENSTIEIAEKGDIAPGIVGMGLSSTVLQDLFSKDLIAARTYSLYIGQGFDRAGGAVNGSNTFGGFDSGRFTGDVHQYPMKTQNVNPLTVRVKDIYITPSDNLNANVSLFDTKVFPNSKPDSFDAELTTDQYPLSLPYDITQNFIAHLGAETDNTWGDNSLKLKDAFNGTLTIVLDDGFEVTIPSEVLMNASNITPIQDRTKDDSKPFYLSAAFLGQVYLMADFESYQFFLAEAVQKNNMVMPETFCKGVIPVAYERPKQSAWVSQGLIGAVVGGVVGGMGVAICAYCFLIAFLRKRQEKQLERQLEKGKTAKMAQFEVEEAQKFEGPPRKPKMALFKYWKR